MATKTKKAVPSFKGLDALLVAVVAAEGAEAERENTYLKQEVLRVKGMPSNPQGQPNRSRDGATLEQLDERIKWNEGRGATADGVAKTVRGNLDKMLKEAKAVTADDVVAKRRGVDGAWTQAWRAVELKNADKFHDPEARRLFTEALNSVLEA